MWQPVRFLLAVSIFGLALPVHAQNYGYQGNAGSNFAGGMSQPNYSQNFYSNLQNSLSPFANYPAYARPNALPTATVSPYLNLLQGNPDLPAYQTLVRPLNDQRAALQRNSSDIYRLQQQASQFGPYGAGSGLTGHSTRFMNYSHFYPAH